MKAVPTFSICALILWAIVAENTSASPLAQPQQSGKLATCVKFNQPIRIIHPFLISGGTSPVGGTKPGSCSRPGFGRKKRSLERLPIAADEDDNNHAEDDFLSSHHFIEKRQVQGGNTGSQPGGNQGGNPWRPPTTRRPVIGRPQCYSDGGCPGKDWLTYLSLCYFILNTCQHSLKLPINLIQVTRNVVVEPVRHQPSRDKLGQLAREESNQNN